MPHSPPARPQKKRRPLVKFWLALLGLGGGFSLFFMLGLENYFALETLHSNRLWLKDLIAKQPILSGLAFILLYMVCVTFSLPIATLLSLTAGFLFGPVLGTFHIAFGATLGATALFLVARSGFGNLFKARLGPWFDRLESGFQRNELSYMLFLRLVPLFPFFVVNLVPAFLNVSLKNFLGATFFGILPAAYFYALAGAGLDEIFAYGLAPEAQFLPENIFTPTILWALTGLAFFTLLPIGYRYIVKVRTARKN